MTDSHHSMLREDEENPLRGLAGAVSVESAEHVEVRRPRIVEALEREIAEAALEKRRARNLRASALGGLVLAAAVGLGFFFVREKRAIDDGAAHLSAVRDGTALVVLVHGGPHTSDAPSATLHAGETILRGQTLLTNPKDELHLELGGKTNVELSPSSNLELERATVHDQAFFLRRGTASFDVPHPPEVGPRLVIVTTPEAKVTVRGTRFGVEVESNPATHVEYTRVWVERGAVSVESTSGAILLGPGEEWRSDRAREATPGREVLPSASASERTIGAPRTNDGFPPSPRQQTARPEQKTEPSVGSSLGEQNEALENALALARSGKKELAAKKLEVFLATYPTSPLRTAALAELRRLQQN